MGNIVDYIREFGDYDFSRKRICIEDLMVLAQLSYLKYKNIVPQLKEEKRGISLKQILSQPGMLAMFENEWLSKDNYRLFWEAANSERFAYVYLSNYVEIADNKRNIGFAAVTFHLPNHFICVAYRGTDEYLAGWIEDSRLAFDQIIPGQEYALAYLKKVYQKEGKVSLVIGHSKGGNLAEYAAFKVNKEIYKGIKLVCNFDGPGQFIRTNACNKIGNKYLKIVPKQSVIGMLYEDAKTVKVVASKGIGLVQHNLYMWKIENGKLIHIKKKAYLVRQLQYWTKVLEKKKSDQIKKILNQLVKLISKSGEDNLLILSKHWFVYGLKK